MTPRYNRPLIPSRESRVRRICNVDDLRLLGQPASSGGKVVGTVVVDVSRVPYEHTEHIALVAALILDTLVLIGLGVLAMRLVSASLRPVGQMTQLAEDWSEHDPDRRFSLGPPHDELTHLAATLDSLLARLSASVRHERYLTDEIAHECVRRWRGCGHPLRWSCDGARGC